MKTVQIFGKQCLVNEQAYNALKSVEGKDECIAAILYVGKQTGAIIEL